MLFVQVVQPEAESSEDDTSTDEVTFMVFVYSFFFVFL